MGKHKELPPFDYLNECFRYDPETGFVYWKERPRKHFKSDRTWKIWNAKRAFKRAFVTSDGYHLQGGLDNVLWLSHRIIWKLVTGGDPVDLIDHKDRNPTNNRFENLRECNHFQNNANHKVKRNNTSGVTGVTRSPCSWIVHIGNSDSEGSYLGSFSSLDEAIKVRKEAENKLYGEFVPCK